MYIRVNLYWGYLIILWLFHLGISWTVFVVTCTVVVSTCFVMCVSFGKMFPCIYCVFVLFIYILSHWFVLYCHRVTTQLQLATTTTTTTIIITLLKWNYKSQRVLIIWPAPSQQQELNNTYILHLILDLTTKPHFASPWYYKHLISTRIDATRRPL
jgi:hypothetical protein